jgi:ubiquinone/menaquinone biosynthesis C-methylase UbiE
MLSFFMLKIKCSVGHSGNPSPSNVVFSDVAKLTLFLLLTCFSARAQDTWKNVYSEENWTDRDRWQKPHELIRHLKIQPGSRVADVGCHEGYMTMKLARAVGAAGKVYAVDIESNKLEKLKAHAASRGLSAIQTVLGTDDDPRLPANELDAVIIVDSYHEMDQHDRILAAIYASLKPGGRLVLCEAIAEERRKASRADQERKHELGLSYALADAQKVGFQLVYRADPFVDRTAEKGDIMWLLVLKK